MYSHLIQWSLRRRPWRPLLIALSVALTVAILIAFFSIRSEIRSALDDHHSDHQRFWIRQRVEGTTPVQYPVAVVDKISRVPGVEFVSYMRTMGAPLQDGTRIGISAVDAKSPRYYPDLWIVPEATLRAWDNDRSGVLVTKFLADRYNLKEGEPWELPLPGGKQLSLKVSGLLAADSPAGATRITVHFDYLDEVLGRPGLVSAIALLLPKGTDARPVIKAVDEAMVSYGSHMVELATRLQISGVKQPHVVPNLLGGLALIMLLTTTMSIINSTMISVRERRAELATLRVVGVKRRVIASAVIGESLLVCVIGGAVGALVAWMGMRDGLSLGVPFLHDLKVNSTGLLAGVAASVVVPVVGGTLASWLAVRAPLHEALRDVS